MARMTKREIQTNVRTTPEDMAMLEKAAKILWQGIPLTRSTLILSLAKRAAEEILSKKK